MSPQSGDIHETRDKSGESVEILSVRIDSLDFSGIMSKITSFLKDDRLHQIATVNPEFVMAAQSDGEFLNILNSTDLNVADGIGLQLAAKIMRVGIGERVTGVDLTRALARLAAEKGYSLFLLGAAEGVAQIAADKLLATFPGLKISGAYAGSLAREGL